MAGDEAFLIGNIWQKLQTRRLMKKIDRLSYMHCTNVISMSTTILLKDEESSDILILEYRERKCEWKL